MGYWEERQAKAQEKLTTKSIKDTEKQLRQYYRSAMLDTIGQFEATYQKLLLSMDEGREVTPADLYKLDKYWKMQGQLKQELQKLGDKQSVLFANQFAELFSQIYEATALKGEAAYTELSQETVEQMINQIWCADGKSWSSRVWDNTDKLQQSLNDNMLHCVLTGKKPSELKKLLMKDFDVSFNRADSVVRTELAHIQTEAARQRYLDSGIKEVEVLVSPDERTCPICGALEGKRFSIGDVMPVPAHPNCRCCIVPVVEDEKSDIENTAAGVYNGFKACFDDRVSFKRNKDVQLAIKSETTNFVRIFEPKTDDEWAEVSYGLFIEETKPLANYYDVKAHGNPVSIKCFNRAINAETLARILTEREDYQEGTPIRLLSCETGKMVDGRCFAQDLANMLNVEVLAPDMILIADSRGTLRKGGEDHGLFKTEDFIRFTPDRI